MLSLIKRKNEATQAAADLELVFRQGCEQKIKDFKVLPNNFYDNTFIVGFIAGVLEALIAVSYTHLTLPTKRIV